MRPDMHKVIVERPRTGGSDDYSGKGRRDIHREKLDLELAPTKENMRRLKHDKALNENLQPLKRFLLKNVGRPWDKVYSEIAKNLRPSNAVKAHVRQHIKDFVQEHPIMVDGVAYETGRYDGLYAIHKKRYSPLYVCPKTGLLKIAKAPKEKKPKHPAPYTRRIGPLSCAVMLRGCWHEATMRLAPLAFYSAAGWPVHDAVLGEVYSTDALKSFYSESKGRTQYAAKIRPMTRDEIKRLPF